MPISDIFDLDGRREGATSEAGNFLQGEQSLVVGIGVIVEIQVSPEGVVD